MHAINTTSIAILINKNFLDAINKITVSEYITKTTFTMRALKYFLELPYREITQILKTGDVNEDPFTCSTSDKYLVNYLSDIADKQSLLNVPSDKIINVLCGETLHTFIKNKSCAENVTMAMWIRTALVDILLGNQYIHTKYDLVDIKPYKKMLGIVCNSILYDTIHQISKLENISTSEWVKYNLKLYIKGKVYRKIINERIDNRKIITEKIDKMNDDISAEQDDDNNVLVDEQDDYILNGFSNKQNNCVLDNEQSVDDQNDSFNEQDDCMLNNEQSVDNSSTGQDKPILVNNQSIMDRENDLKKIEKLEKLIFDLKENSKKKLSLKNQFMKIFNNEDNF